MITWIYDRTGQALALFDADKNLHVVETGVVAAFSWGRHLFTKRGEHVGTFDDGWLRDADGDAVGFTDAASGGPDRPRTQALPAKKALSSFSDKPVRGPIPQLPAPTGAWSVVDLSSFLACLVDRDGDPFDVGKSMQRWRWQRDKAAAPAPAAVPSLAPQVEGELAALNAALAAYREALAEGGRALALARVELGAEVERFAITSTATVRTA
jgi:hypothetical protein